MRRKHPKKRKHNIIVPDIDGSEAGPTKVSMDYIYFSERKNDSEHTPTNPPHLIVIDHRHGRVWAHRVPQKGSLGQAEWVPRRVTQDLVNNGMQNIRVHVKTGQEVAMVNLQIAMQDPSPYRIIPVNSPVGESECNGRVENTIRRVQEKVRTLRFQIESNTKCKIPDEAPLMHWLVRWAAELLSKYVVGSEWKTFYERVHKEDCATPLVPFGETIMYLPLKTIPQNKGVPARKIGIWLGVSERIEETLVGTKNGVVKCRIENRQNETDRWSRENVLGMQGPPCEPVPGKASQHIPVDVFDDGECMGPDSENEDLPTKIFEDEAEERGFKIGMDKFHVSRKAIMEFGETAGCPACDIIRKRGNRPGRI